MWKDLNNTPASSFTDSSSLPYGGDAGEDTFLSSRSSSAAHRLSFQSLNAAISRSNEILTESVLANESLQTHVNHSQKIYTQTVESRSLNVLDAVNHNIADDVSAAPFGGTSEICRRLEPAATMSDQALSKGSDTHSNSSVGPPPNEQFHAKAQAAANRHSMAASWVADLQLQPVTDFHMAESGTDDPPMLRPGEEDEVHRPTVSECLPEWEAGSADINEDQTITDKPSISADSPSATGNVACSTEAMQKQLNQAVAAAVASAAVSAVVESHAAAARAALLVSAHEQHVANEQKCREKEVEVSEKALAHARVRIAAMQVARHWKSWRHSSAWWNRTTSATLIQAHLRGFLVRHNLSSIQNKATCVKQVRACIKNQASSTAALQAALQSARDLQDEHAIETLSMRIDAVVGRISAALMTAARTGTHEQYRRVQAEAELVKPQLQQCLVEAARCMSDRQAHALQQLKDICHSGSICEYSKTVQAATNCGVEPVMIAKQKKAWHSRCSVAALELSAAAHAKHFEAEDFSSSRQKAQDLGLADAVRAANCHLKARRSELVREIHLARKGGNMELLQSLRSHAATFDMQDVLLSIDSTLQAHVAVTEQRLHTAASSCSNLPVFVSYAQAARDAGVSEEVVARCHSTFSARAQQAGSKLLKSAATEPLSHLLPLVKQAWALDQQDAVSDTVRLASTRVKNCCTSLRSALSDVSRNMEMICEAENIHRSVVPSILPCLAATLLHFRFNSLQRSQVFCGRCTGSPAAGDEERSVIGSASSIDGKSSSVCSLCRACLSISTGMQEAFRLYLGQLASRANSALLCSITRCCVAATTCKKVHDVVHDYHGWIHGGHSQAASNSGRDTQQGDELVASYQSQCRLQPAIPAADPAVLCACMRFMIGLYSFRAQQLPCSNQEPEPGTHLVQPQPDVPSSLQVQSAPDGALDLSETLLQTILGEKGQSQAKELCLIFSGLRSVGKLGTWCPRLQSLSLKANHLQCVRSLAPLAAHLSHLDISDNSFSALTSLSMLTCLRSLAVSNNALTSLHGISSMKYLQVFMASHNSVCSVDPSTFSSTHIAHIDLSGNCITCISGLTECHRLLVADLSRNLIVSLHALSSCSLLQDVSVSENRVQSISGVFCRHLCLQRLKIATNRLSTLAPLPWLPHLRSLDVSDNPITTVHAFSLQPALTKLNISFCSLGQKSILAAVAPLGQLVSLQAHDNCQPHGQNEGADSSNQQVPLATLRALPSLRDLDHMETRCCDIFQAAVASFRAAPHSLLAWRAHVMSGEQCTPPINTSTMEAMTRRTDTDIHLRGDQDMFSLAELLVALDVHRGAPVALPDPTEHMPRAACPPSMDHPRLLEAHEVIQLRLQLHEQYSLLTAHSGGCAHLLKSLLAGVSVDHRMCTEQLSTALQQAQASAAASVLSMTNWRPREGAPPLYMNAEWQERWHQLRDQAAAKLQCAWRRQRACKEQTIHRYNEAATCIQSWIRGAQVRGEGVLHRLRRAMHERRRCAALLVQASWRGHRVRSLLARARVTAHRVGIVAEQAQGIRSPPSSTGSNEDLSLPDLGTELMRELDLLDSAPLSGGMLGVGGTVAGAIAEDVRRVAVRETDMLLQGSLRAPATLPEPATSSSLVMANPLQKMQLNKQHHGSNVSGSGTCHLPGSIDADSALARRYRLHKMQQAERQLANSGIENSSSSAEHATCPGAALPAYRGTVDMPPVHVAAIAAMRVQKQQVAAPLLPASDTLASSGVQSVLQTVTSQQEPECSDSHTLTLEHRQGVHPNNSRKPSETESVMKEWGFENKATAKAYLRSKRRMHNKKHSRTAGFARSTSCAHLSTSCNVHVGQPYCPYTQADHLCTDKCDSPGGPDWAC